MLHHPLHVADDQRAYLQGFLVIRIKVARAQGVGAQQNAALHLRTEALAAALHIQLFQIGVFRRTAAVAHAVEAGQIGGGLGGGDHIIGGKRVIQRGDADLGEDCALFFQQLCRVEHLLLDLGGKSLAEEFLGQGDLEALHALVQLTAHGGVAALDAGGIQPVIARQRVQHQRVVPHGAGHGADLIQR